MKQARSEHEISNGFGGFMMLVAACALVIIIVAILQS